MAYRGVTERYPTLGNLNHQSIFQTPCLSTFFTKWPPCDFFREWWFRWSLSMKKKKARVCTVVILRWHTIHRVKTFLEDRNLTCYMCVCEFYLVFRNCYIDSKMTTFVPNIYVHMGQMDTNSLKYGGDGFASVGPFIFCTSFRQHDLEQDEAH